MFAAGKKIKNLTISASYFEAESIDGVLHFSFSFIFHEAKEVMEEMENWEDIPGTMRNLGLQRAVA